MSIYKEKRTINFFLKYVPKSNNGETVTARAYVYRRKKVVYQEGSKPKDSLRLIQLENTNARAVGMNVCVIDQRGGSI
jgi:hypothetical protein